MKYLLDKLHLGAKKSDGDDDHGHIDVTNRVRIKLTKVSTSNDDKEKGDGAKNGLGPHKSRVAIQNNASLWFTK